MNNLSIGVIVFLERMVCFKLFLYDWMFWIGVGKVDY